MSTSLLRCSYFTLKRCVSSENTTSTHTNQALLPDSSALAPFETSPAPSLQTPNSSRFILKTRRPQTTRSNQTFTNCRWPRLKKYLSFTLQTQGCCSLYWWHGHRVKAHLLQARRETKLQSWQGMIIVMNHEGAGSLLAIWGGHSCFVRPPVSARARLPRPLVTVLLNGRFLDVYASFHGAGLWAG